VRCSATHGQTITTTTVGETGQWNVRLVWSTREKIAGIKLMWPKWNGDGQLALAAWPDFIQAFSRHVIRNARAAGPGPDLLAHRLSRDYMAELFDAVARTNHPDRPGTRSGAMSASASQRLGRRNRLIDHAAQRSIVDFENARATGLANALLRHMKDEKKRPSAAGSLT
jgi:hypothetical protein